MPEYLTRTAFEPHLNTTFQMKLEGGSTIDLELVEANDKTPERFDGEQFSLIFKGPADIFVPQQTCPMEHAAMGELYLFLVPVDQQEDGYYYEAFFNHAADLEG